MSIKVFDGLGKLEGGMNDFLVAIFFVLPLPVLVFLILVFKLKVKPMFGDWPIR